LSSLPTTQTSMPPAVIFLVFSCTLYSIRTCFFVLIFPHFAFWPYLQQTTQTPNTGGIRTRNPSKRWAADPRLRLLGHWNGISRINLYNYQWIINWKARWKEDLSLILRNREAFLSRNWVNAWHLSLEQRYETRTPVIRSRRIKVSTAYIRHVVACGSTATKHAVSYSWRSHAWKKRNEVFEGELHTYAGQTLCDASYIKVKTMKIIR
jgi:hypothetical protein